MNLFDVLDISGSALTAERQRAEVISSNLANAETTRSAQGGPYRSQRVVFAAGRLKTSSFEHALSSADRSVQGVSVKSVTTDPTPPVRRFEPSHPDADADGYVSYPAVNPVAELADLMGAARSYELNAAAVQATKLMIQQSLDILR